ncbi:hypothetical protein EGM87_15995 [Sphingobium sp. RSMS]|uniref:hypothetical protein n=1 Tax=Sphingobium sp. RSMS TaxID=520734 RepID=UPI0010F9FAC4|nr:hypothetical protein [Sphingobium sp. RSMS]UXC90514.1 hypothetical protein EGM87_15995 [Sphingobium sp. RSMS]
MITVTLPDGRRIDVQTDDPKRAAQIAHTYGRNNPKVERSTKNTLGGIAGLWAEGILPGASEFIRGAREVAVNAVQAPFSDNVDFHPMDSYNKGRAFQRARNRAAVQQHPTASAIAQTGGLASSLLLPSAKVVEGASLAGKALAGAKTAGAYGLLSGAMSSDKDTLTGRAADAISSGALSSVVGAGLPVALKAAGTLAAPIRPLSQPVTRIAGRGLEGLADVLPSGLSNWARKEGQQLSRDPIQAAANNIVDQDLRAAINPATGKFFTPEEVAEAVRQRQARGIPAAPADVHESARRSFGSAARSPGPATAAVRAAIDRRQEQSSARMVQHINETLGQTTNVGQQAEDLQRYAREASRPLYEISDAQPIPLVQELQELFQRPSARDALANAGGIIKDEGIDPRELGLIEGADGIWELGKTPTMKAYDYAKTALDDMVQPLSNPMASSAERRGARGANTIRQRLLEIMDGDGSGPRVHQAPEGLPQGPGAIQPTPQAPEAFPGLPKPPPQAATDLPRLPAPGAPDPQPGNPFPVPYEAPSQRIFPEAPPQAPQGPRESAIPPEGLNPFWKPARDAYAGPIQAKQALELGKEKVGDKADEVTNAFNEVTGLNQDFFRLGHRSGLAGDVRKAEDGANVAARIAGSENKRANLKTVHGDLADGLLERTLGEHEAHQTFRTIRGNSATADRLAEMAGQGERAGNTASGVLQMVAGNPLGGAVQALKGFASGRNEGAIKGEVARKLGDTDMASVLRTVEEIAQERLRRSQVDRRVTAGTLKGGRIVGSLFGQGMIERAE